ncbi:hypothetical protein Y1Q_0013299 [Alligator mississippiensis]|uniref:ribonuclease H n=1 Tax=Alligator mississippiensis TaxID=8496 RepID=A0A151NTA7_ALLMI|nr:hypothetical protein Y1Q_0013299 [Alligator mississippiensis]
MLKAYVDSNPNDWDEELPRLLFAYREVPQESTGFSPFKLMFGRSDVVFWISSVEGSPKDPEEPVMYGDWDGEAGIEEFFLPDHLPSQDKDKQFAALKDFETVFFNKPGKTNLAIHSTDTGSYPPIQSRLYTVNAKVMQAIKWEITEMRELGVIRPSVSPWASPVVLVRKQNGSIRFCVDYRKLNAITTSDAYPMPRTDSLLDCLGPAEIISTFALSKGFWQMALDPDAIAKSAFTTLVGLYAFTVLPFGMRNPPSSFQRLINNQLQGYEQFSMAYISDIAIFSQDFDSHLIHLTTVLDKIKQAGLTIKAKKCQLALSEVVYLGHRVGGGQISLLWDKIEAIRDWPPLQTK